MQRLNLLSSPLIALALVGVASMAHSQDEVDVDGICERTARVSTPDFSLSETQKARLASCDSVNLYYGIGVPQDYRAARLCAVAEINGHRETVLGGHAMLMVIYANGHGVQRNLPFAMKLACAGDGAPAEIAGRVKHLKAMQDAKGRTAEFAFCDDATSGFLAGACTELEGRANAHARRGTLKDLEAQVSKEAAKAYANLKKRTDAFHDGRVANEVDLSGTMRGTYSLEEHAALDQTHLQLFSSLASGKLPSGAGDVSKVQADQELNRVYKLVQTVPESKRLGTVTNTGIRDAQRLWIKYRDAWLAFAAVQFPSVDRDSLLSWLTVTRTAQLHEHAPPAP